MKKKCTPDDKNKKVSIEKKNHYQFIVIFITSTHLEEMENKLGIIYVIIIIYLYNVVYSLFDGSSKMLHWELSFFMYTLYINLLFDLISPKHVCKYKYNIHF